MTDPFRPDDELVSAVLDGEATPDERARVEADPVLSARLAEFRAVRDAVAAPVPAPADRERAIAAAMAAGRRPAPVRELRRRSTFEPQRILAVAAALVLVVGFGFLLTQVDTDDDDSAGGGDAALDTTAADAPADALEEGGTEASGDSASEFDDAGAGNDEFGLVVIDGSDLGRFADTAELRSSLATNYQAGGEDGGQESTTTAPGNALPQAAVDEDTSGRSDACQVGLVEADSSLSGLLAKATADVAGTPVVVYVYGTPEGRPRVIVVSAAGCRTLTAFDL